MSDVATVTFHEEAWAQAWPDIEPLTHAHWQETQREHDTMPLDLNLNAYRFMEERGSLSVVTARANGVLVGYCTSFLHYHLKSQQVLVAVLDAYYLLPPVRGQGVGKALLLYAQQCLKERGVQRLFGDTKAWQDLSAMFEKDGWAYTGKTYSKWIGD